MPGGEAQPPPLSPPCSMRREGGCERLPTLAPGVQWVLLAAVLLGFSILEYRNVRDRVQLRALRQAVTKQSVPYRTPISAQWKRGWRGRGNAKGLQLVVREKSFELSYPFPTLGLLGTEWYCRAQEARMTTGRGRFLPPKVTRTWIVLSIPAIYRPEERQEILLSSLPPSTVLRHSWDALVRSSAGG